MGRLNRVFNLVVLSLTTIENDLFGRLVEEEAPFYNEKISLIWYVKLVKHTSIFSVVFFTAKINDYKPVLFFPSCLA